MEKFNINGNNYKIIKKIVSDNWIYYYTLDENNDNEVVILCESMLENDKKIEKVDEREYPILMNKFALK